MPRRKPIHNKALRAMKKSIEARLALRVLKINVCVDNRMSKTEMHQFTGLSLKNIERVFDENPELAARHTFSLLQRTEVDDVMIKRKLKREFTV